MLLDRPRAEWNSHLGYRNGTARDHWVAMAQAGLYRGRGGQWDRTVTAEVPSAVVAMMMAMPVMMVTHSGVGVEHGRFDLHGFDDRGGTAFGGAGGHGGCGKHGSREQDCGNGLQHGYLLEVDREADRSDGRARRSRRATLAGVC
jgi:hypothetical protein